MDDKSAARTGSGRRDGAAAGGRGGVTVETAGQPARPAHRHVPPTPWPDFRELGWNATLKNDEYCDVPESTAMSMTWEISVDHTKNTHLKTNFMSWPISKPRN